MTDRQTAFFQCLLEPFPPSAYYQKQGFTYIRAETIENRLDDVAGPLGWTAEYMETKGGFKCALKIRCPDEADGFRWHHKENGAGQEDMVKGKDKNGNPIPDEDNTEKSAYTNAFKRAAKVWGIGRDLYGQGMPHYVANLYAKSKQGSNEPSVQTQTTDPVYHPTTQNGQRQTNLVQPTEPRHVFPWIKNIEKHFGRTLLDQVNQFCTKTFGTWDTRKLNSNQVLELDEWVICQVKQWPDYDGIWDPKDKILGDNEIYEVKDLDPDSPMFAVINAILNDKDKTPRGNLKRAIIAACKAIIFKQTGREAREHELEACIADIANAVPNSRGVTGEVLVSLKAVEDDVWLKRILEESKKQMLRSDALQAMMKEDEEDHETPF